MLNPEQPQSTIPIAYDGAGQTVKPFFLPRRGLYSGPIMGSIRIAIAGVGNCASSLVQGLGYYSQQADTVGLLHPVLGGYRAGDIQVVAAFDID